MKSVPDACNSTCGALILFLESWTISIDKAFFLMVVVGDSVSFGEFDTICSISFGSLGSLAPSSAAAASTSGSAYGSIDG